ncbi:MAG: pirin family protein [Proteobacteria bacterium]|nr:pirin family protein [Pseudomonadota bacterium]
MITIRKSYERGATITPWLKSYHSFSFGNYYDSHFINFGPLRVINEDWVQPGMGFGKHHHDNMEIITFVVEGALKHRDSTGHSAIINAGEIQKMSAGSGIEHSEFNPSKTDLLHLLQIWIIPEEVGLTPGYDQKTFRQAINQWILLGSANEQENAVKIHQDVELYTAKLTTNSQIEYHFLAERFGWLQLIRGNIKINGRNMVPGDGCAIIQEANITIDSFEDAQLLLFDLGN